ncbi:MAG: type I-C CRISPR-associated protein Cas5c [Pirellulales bacterium]
MAEPTRVTHIIDVRGDFACFSRPELKVERWSYPCPTPSAARGVFEAIYFKPQFYWQVERIELLAAPAYIALRRNEVSQTGPTDRTVKSWAKGTVSPKPIHADADTVRQQRQTMALRNPHFRLHGRIVSRNGNGSEQKAFDNQFIRRARHGKCFQQPYFGCREFAAYYRFVQDPNNESSPIDYSQNLGHMLYDVFDLKQVNTCSAPPYISVFSANIEQGVLEVPPFASDLVLKPEPAGRAEGRSR